MLLSLLWPGQFNARNGGIIFLLLFLRSLLPCRPATPSGIGIIILISSTAAAAFVWAALIPVLLPCSQKCRFYLLSGHIFLPLWPSLYSLWKGLKINMCVHCAVRYNVFLKGSSTVWECQSKREARSTRKANLLSFICRHIKDDQSRKYRQTRRTLVGAGKAKINCRPPNRFSFSMTVASRVRSSIVAKFSSTRLRSRQRRTLNNHSFLLRCFFCRMTKRTRNYGAFVLTLAGPAKKETGHLTKTDEWRQGRKGRKKKRDNQNTLRRRRRRRNELCNVIRALIL